MSNNNKYVYMDVIKHPFKDNRELQVYLANFSLWKKLALCIPIEINLCVWEGVGGGGIMRQWSLRELQRQELTGISSYMWIQ